MLRFKSPKVQALSGFGSNAYGTSSGERKVRELVTYLGQLLWRYTLEDWVYFTFGDVLTKSISILRYYRSLPSTHINGTPSFLMLLVERVCEQSTSVRHVAQEEAHDHGVRRRMIPRLQPGYGSRSQTSEKPNE